MNGPNEGAKFPAFKLVSVVGSAVGVNQWQRGVFGRARVEKRGVKADWPASQTRGGLSTIWPRTRKVVVKL